jgi:UDP-N-acetylglucosamine 2-epimerase (non-hydrolysing)
MASVIRALCCEPTFDVLVLATVQHWHMLNQVLRVFDIKPDIDLNIMRPNQSGADHAHTVAPCT